MLSRIPLSCTSSRALLFVSCSSESLVFPLAGYERGEWVDMVGVYIAFVRSLTLTLTE